MNKKTRSLLDDKALIYLLRQEDEETKEIALEHLLEKYSNTVYRFIKRHKVKPIEFQANAFLVLSQLICQYVMSDEIPLYLCIERNLDKRLMHILAYNDQDVPNNNSAALSMDIEILKQIYPPISQEEISRVLQIPFGQGLTIVQAGERYGFTPLVRQIGRIPWLIFFRFHQGGPEISHSSLNRYLGFHIGQIKKIEWRTKYEIFDIIQEG